MKKVLVMGGNGFIGSNIVKYFLDQGVYVSTYDIKQGNYGVENYAGNVFDDKNFDDIVAQYDTIIYLITTVSPKKSMDFPDSAYKNDVPLFLKTLESCVKNGVKRVVFSSSGGTIYGENNGKNSLEDDSKEPINNYAICKLTCEHILSMYNKLYNMENVSLRVSNPYGVGQNPASGVGVITTFVDRICNDDSINLYGDGSITRDFIDVNEVAQAFYLASKWDFDKTISPIFNIGSGQGVSLKQVISIIEETLNITPNINYLPDRDFDVKYNVLNIEKAKKYLGYNVDSDEQEKIKTYVLKMSENYNINSGRKKI